MIGSPFLIGDDGISHPGDADFSTGLVIDVTLPEPTGDAFGPMRGLRKAQAASNCIPLTRGLEKSTPKENPFKALCSADGTASAPTALQAVGSLCRSRSAARSRHAPAFPPRWIDTGTTSPTPTRNA
ncbi:hypothetical protein [Alloyangia pacifica]|nr:hypothetical protein [Alloyangia pacifica]